jgi:DNA-binding transcriptional MerR regulator
MRTFTSQEVLDLTGITYRQLDHWVTTGFVRIDAARPGTGNSRTFSYSETLRLMVLASLIHAGVTVRTASAQFARYGMHNGMTELVYQNGPVSITLDMRALISKLES